MAIENDFFLINLINWGLFGFVAFVCSAEHDAHDDNCSIYSSTK